MAQINRKRREEGFEKQIRDILEPYRKEHPQAKVDVYRQNPASIRVRVKDPDFQGIDWVDRDSLIWAFLEALPDEVQGEISMLVLVTPKEARTSLANLEFEDPTPSRI